MANRESAPVSTQACAACKHQRKRCDRNCALAPYFPARKYQEFQDVHKLFGVSNIHKILAVVEPHQREAAAKTLIIEGLIRRRDPVRGCHGVIKKLTAQIEMYQKELSLVKQQLAIHKQQQDQKEEEDESNDLPDLPCELLDDMRKFEQGYYEMSNLEEEEDDEKYSIDMEILEAVDDHGKSLAYNNSAGKSGIEFIF